MTITFYSNYLNHHQLPFCLEMLKQPNVNFTFVADASISQERLDLGYEDMNKKYTFVLRAYESQENKTHAINLAINSDVIIHGAADEQYIVQRMQFNKLTFRYSERILRSHFLKACSPKMILHMLRTHAKYKTKSIYMLTASAFTASDFLLYGAYKNKCYKWGYFPAVQEYDIEKLQKNKSKEKIILLWCGRFLNWKHPEKAIEVTKKLKKDGYNFELQMIGSGEELESIKKLIESNNLSDYVTLLGSMDSEKVRAYMEKANIFLFTSNKKEGWGAVLNESMNSGCAVVASHVIGSVPYLIKDTKNGLIYKDNSIDDLYSKVKLFMDNKELRESCGRNAYVTLKKTWNAENVAESFLHLCENLLNNKDTDIDEGPCSKAEILKDNWY